MQKNDNPKYRDQRRNPKVIVPESFHKDGYANDFTIGEAFAMRNMPRLVKLDEVWNEALSCGITYKHTSLSPKALCLVNHYQCNNTFSPKMLRQDYHHQYLNRAPRRSLALHWIKGLHQRVKHK